MATPGGFFLLPILLVAESFQGIDVRSFTGREDAGHETDKGTEGDDRHDKPQWTIEEIDRFSTKTSGDQVDEKIEHFTFDHAQDDTT